ncbi:MAG: hypothetical protein ABMA01_02605 [Chthoniobacteraceae bacterium]
MKNILLILNLLGATLHAAERKEEFPEFMDLSKRGAAAVARRQAETDFAAGHYRMLVYGLSGPVSKQDRRLAKEGVEVKPIAGCMVSDGILEGARVYNEVMREKLKAKLGRDVFNDKDEARKGNQK